MKAFIYNTIKDCALNQYGYKTKWIRKNRKIIELLGQLDPRVPTTNPGGNISFNVYGKARVRTRIARFLTRKLNLNNDFFPDKILRQISDTILSKYFGEIIIRLDKGEKITENYENEIGGHSCMTGDCAEYTLLYEMNPDRFEQLVVLHDNDSARAMVALLDNGQKYCDKCYSTSDFVYEKLQQYAKKQGWANYNIGNGNLIMSGLNFEEGHVPYMDTFFHYKLEKSEGKQTLTIFACETRRSYEGCLDSTEGNFFDRHYCISCEDSFCEEEMTVIDGDEVCKSCFDEHYFCCEECGKIDHNDFSHSIQDVCFCEGCYNKLGVVCEDCSEYVFQDCCIITWDGNFICEDCKDDYVKCLTCKDWFKQESCTDGYCNECFKEKEEYEKEKVS